MKEVIKSSTFCILPWVHLEAKPNGSVSACCYSQEYICNQNGEPFNLQKDTLSDCWKSDYLKSLRDALSDGVKHSNCIDCWKEEEVGRDSLRIRKNLELKHHLDNVKMTFPKSLDLKLGNQCNLKCKICDSHSSSQWALEKGESNENYTWPLDNHKLWEDLQENLNAVENIEFYGGEPFLNKKHFEVLNYCVEKGYAKDISLNYSTNGTLLPKDAIENIWPEFKSVNISFSIDGINEKFEEQRSPAKWSKVEANILSFKDSVKKHPNLTLTICPTVSVLNIYDLSDLIDWCDKNHMNIWFNILHAPMKYNIKTLSKSDKKEISSNLLGEIIKNKMNRKQLQDIIKFMNYEEALSK